MTRQLRPRKSRTNYAALADFDTDEEKQARAGPSSINTHADITEVESDFMPEKNEEKAKEREDLGEDIAEDDAGENGAKVKPESGSLTNNSPSGKQSSKAGKNATRQGQKRSQYALPTPLVNHRHRGVPLFSRSARVERLAEPPKLFGPTSTVLTTSFTNSSKVTDRVSKAWGFNVGPGPLWQLAEDRGWFKEAEVIGNDVELERKRRPRVYREVRVRAGLELLGAENAVLYLPRDGITTKDGNFRPPPPVPCFFGPVGSQHRREMNTFEAFAMSVYTLESKAHILNAGAPVWGMDWCPIHPDDRSARSFKKYLAIATLPFASHSPVVGRKVARPSYSCIQIWSLSSLRLEHQPSVEKGSNKNIDNEQMKCEMVLCLDTGPAHDIKWCPLPSHDLKSEPGKLGLLGGTFEDGTFAIFVVPDPDDVTPHKRVQSSPLFVRLTQPILRIELEETSCWSFDWASSGLIAIGTTNGIIIVYDITSTLQSAVEADCPTRTDLLPTHYLAVHQTAIRALTWIRTPPSGPSGEARFDQDPTVIASVGYDGLECFTDIREGRGTVMNRTRDVINAIAYSPFSGGPIMMDHENMVKAYSASPSMLGRGHSLFEPQGSIWSVHASDYHPQLAVASADGSCSTTNMLRSTRRGGSVPFFVHKIFQIDYNRRTKEFRMLDQFLPQEIVDRPSAARNAKVSENTDAERGPTVPTRPISTGAWPQQVGVNCVVWNNGDGIASSTLLASGTASGLCRVDVLLGRWLRDKIPYGGIEGIRMEHRVKTEDNLASGEESDDGVVGEESDQESSE